MLVDHIISFYSTLKLLNTPDSLDTLVAIQYPLDIEHVYNVIIMLKCLFKEHHVGHFHCYSFNIKCLL